MSQQHCRESITTMGEDPFVTEEAALHTKIIRGIHHMALEGDAVRIFTYDLIPHAGGTEKRINGDMLFRKDELTRMLGEVSDLLFKSAATAIADRIKDSLALVRPKVH